VDEVIGKKVARLRKTKATATARNGRKRKRKGNKNPGTAPEQSPRYMSNPNLSTIYLGLKARHGTDVLPRERERERERVARHRGATAHKRNLDKRAKRLSWAR